MTAENLSRRSFMKHVSLTTAAALAGTHLPQSLATESNAGLHVACNSYSWYAYYQREGKDFYADIDAGLAEVAAAGLDGYEPGIGKAGDIDNLISPLKKHNLQMRSIYIGTTLHDRDKAKDSIRNVLAIAEKAKVAGTSIIVTNPDPLSWESGQAKTDDQLKVQSEMLNTLGEKLKGMGVTLAYHNHNMELKNAAREFHHVMLGTDPANLSLCLDAHWIYRGSGDSQVSLFDILKLYGERVSELHLRQSQDGVWTETFTDGDIDYGRLIDNLLSLKVKPHLVVEQAPENGTPKTMSAREALTMSTEYTRKIFARFA